MIGAVVVSHSTDTVVLVRGDGQGDGVALFSLGHIGIKGAVRGSRKCNVVGLCGKKRRSCNLVYLLIRQHVGEIVLSVFIYVFQRLAVGDAHLDRIAVNRAIAVDFNAVRGVRPAKLNCPLTVINHNAANAVFAADGADVAARNDDLADSVDSHFVALRGDGTAADIDAAAPEARFALEASVSVGVHSSTDDKQRIIATQS